MAGTGKDLIAFLDGLTARGRINSSYKTACRKILVSVYGTDWEAVDLVPSEVEKILVEAEQRLAPSLSPNSWETYKSRFRTAVPRFLAGEWPPAPDADDERGLTVGIVCDNLSEDFGDWPLTPAQSLRLMSRLTRAIIEEAGGPR